MKNSSLVIIDDDEIFQLLIKKILEQRKAVEKIHQFYNGTSALNYFKLNITNTNILPPLIFLDLSMPGMSGFEFLKQFEKLQFQNLYNPLIYAISGTSNIHDLEALREFNSVKGFLSKPIAPNEFINIINDSLKKQNAWA